MRVLNVFSFLLIAGIFGCTIADEESTTSSPETLPLHLQFFNHVNTTEDDITNNDRNMCIRNGGPDAFETLKFNWDAWENTLMQVSRDVKTMQANAPTNAIPNAPELFCEMVPTLEISWRNVTDSFEDCLDTDKKAAAQVIYNVTTSVIRFMCENGAARLTNFEQLNKETDFACMKSKKFPLADCLDDTILSHMESKTSDGNTMGILWMAQWFIPDAEKCSVLSAFQTCVVKELKGCAPPTPADLVDSIFNHMKTTIRCDAHVNTVSPTV